MKSVLISTLAAMALSFSAQAKQKTVLFIGNSYTYYPMEPSRPGLPYFVEQIAQSIDPTMDVVDVHHTIPNATLELHYNNVVSRALMVQSYDEVILQGRSTDPLKVPDWFRKQGMLGLQSFKAFLPRVLQLVLDKSPQVTMFVPWGYHPNHEYFKSSQGEFKSLSPDEWKGQTGLEYQRLIDRGYIESAQGYPVAFSFVGDEWIFLAQNKLVNLDELYVPNDWSHPSALGSMVAALVLTRDVFRLDLEKNSFVPNGLDSERLKKIAKALNR